MNPSTDFNPNGRSRRSGSCGTIWKDTRAVAATEFALILPVMFLLLIGMAEVTGAMNQDRKVARISNAVTDLVAQAETVTEAELLGVLDLGEQVLAPYPADELDIIVASVSFDEDGDAEVDWSFNSGGDNPWTEGAEPPITLPDTIAAPNTSIVVGVTTLNYSPPFAGIFTDFFTRKDALELSHTYYLRPRLTDTVQCSDC
ncbi:TadE/TadG family type IV pilus assembly protein [Roseibium sp.]|uniref:TadE/TadG family type IV pilus assembly protein n=1 Tax=Roseibium sp. TaxID=1936156 RepID=UPI003BB1B161